MAQEMTSQTNPSLTRLRQARKKPSWTGLFVVGLLVLIYFWIFPLGYGTETWHEEVQLADGRQAVVEQVRHCQRPGRNKSSWICRSSEIRFQKPNDLGIRVDWIGPVIPLIFNDWHGEFYIVGSFATDREYIADGMPDHGYIGYKYLNGVWHRIDFAEIPPEIYEGNLLVERLPPEGSEFVSIRDKAEDINGHTTTNSYVDPTFRDIR